MSVRGGIRRLVPAGAYLALSRLKDRRLKGRDPKDIFSEIYSTNSWRGTESASGTGSDASQTAAVKAELSAVLRGLNIASVLDIPCGDFHWMKDVDLGGASYVGADIVPQLIEMNQRFADERRRFLCLNLIEDDLPPADLVIVRDCLVHFSFDHILAALDRVVESGAQYLLTTTFTGRKRNHDIHTGQWRPLNMQIPPFGLPEPARLIDERCTEAGGAYADKSLGLWRTADIRRGR